MKLHCPLILYICQTLSIFLLLILNYEQIHILSLLDRQYFTSYHKI